MAELELVVVVAGKIFTAGDLGYCGEARLGSEATCTPTCVPSVEYLEGAGADALLLVHPRRVDECDRVVARVAEEVAGDRILSAFLDRVQVERIRAPELPEKWVVVADAHLHGGQVGVVALLDVVEGWREVRPCGAYSVRGG